MRRIILILLLVIVVVGAVFYIREKKKVATSGIAPSGVFKSFFPLNTAPVTIPSSTVPSATDTAPATTKTSRFTQISSRAIAGFSAYVDTYKVTTPATTPKGKPTIQTVTDNVIRYISRTNGFVYEKRNSDTPVQVSNIYIPNIYEGMFMDSNNTAVLRFLRDDNQTIATYLVPISPKNADGTRTQATGRFFNDAIEDFAVSPDENEALRIYPTSGGNSGNEELLISNSSDKNRIELSNSPFNEWLADWPTKQTIYLQTKAAATAPGYLYKVDRTERKLRRVLGDINGLTTSVSPSGRYILYSESVQNSFQTVLFDTQTNKSTTLSLKVLPEKCVWYIDSNKAENVLCAGSNSVPSAIYPDSWYAGLTHFSDDIFRIAPATTTYEILYDDSDGSFDMTNLQYNQNNNSLYFTDKTTGLLWQYSL